MTIKATRNGMRLKLSADNAARSELADMLRISYARAEQFIGECLHESWEFIQPEQVGALTSSPILADCHDIYRDDDSGELLGVGDVAWFPNYAVRCPWAELARTGRVVFDIAPQESQKVAA